MKTKLSTLILLLALGASVGICQQDKLSPALSSLVAAERAFAQTSVDKGIRASFLEFFAEDGINFQPHPTKTRAAFLKRPAPATKPPVTLNWEPAYADVSQAGDLGYTTGPYTFTDQSPQKQPPSYGFYFSIWKKQADGAWKVVLDCGIDTPDHSNRKFEFKAAPEINRSRQIRKIDLESERASLIVLDRQFLDASRSAGVLNGFLAYLSKDARLHRNGVFPLIGRDAIRTFLSTGTAELTWEPINSDVSRSGDLGYTYGSYEMKSAGTKETEKGYYVRVWKRDAKWNWKLMLDTLSPVPPEK
jgi:ketosteroid isomerase-like protein